MSLKKSVPLVCLIVLLMLSACSPAAKTVTYKDPTLSTEGLGTADDLQPTDDETKTAVNRLAAEKSFIGVIACTYSTEYHATVADSAKAYGEKLGLDVRTFDSQTNVDKQIGAIENFISSGAKVIVICEFDPPSVESALKDAASKGVYIIEYAGRNVAAFGGVSISIEDADLGAAAGGYAGELIQKEFGGKAMVAILDYPDLANVVIRADNIKKSLLEKAPNAEIVGNYLGGTADNGLSSMETALQAHPEINVIASINDAGALGAMQALTAAGKTPSDTIIVGIDAEKQAVDYISQSTLYRGTIDTAPAKTGEMTIDAAIKMLAGSALPQNIKVPVNIVTRDNASDFIKK